MRRIGIDIEDLMRMYTDIEVNAIYQKKETKITFGIKIEHHGINFEKIQIILQNDRYPFLPPDILVNNIPYIDSLKTKSKKINGFIQTCLCCVSIFRKENWLPSFQLSHIFNEMEEINKCKRKVKYKIAVDTIGKKYKIPSSIEHIIMDYLSPKDLTYDIYP